MHKTLQKNSELLVNYFQNLVLKSQLTWSYYYYEHEIKLKFKQLLIDQYSDLYKQQTSNKLFNLDPQDLLINKFKLKTLFEQLQQKQQYTPNTINIYTVASNLFTDNLDGLATQFQCNKQSIIIIKDKTESKFKTALEESNILIDLIGSTLGNRHNSNNIPNCKHNEYNWYFQVHSIDDPNQQSNEQDNNTQVTLCLNRLIKLKDKECPQQISVIKETKCGNGIIEPNEQCDCDSLDTKCFNCCDMKTCQFRTKESECSTGDCCNQTTCKLKPKTQICRYAANNQTESTCDWAEYCDASSPQCPEDKHHHNGINCSENNEHGICWNAKCISTNLQCKQLWSTKAINSDKSCYNNFNTIGFENGNCGQTVNTTIKYKPCHVMDSECGLLQCQQGSNEPLIKSETYFKSTTSVKGHNYECKSITNEPSIYVQDGSKCNQNSVCVQQKCLSLNEIVSVATNKCVKAASKELCSNNGVCDNKQQCNCFTNWSGQYCDQFTVKSLNLDNKEQFKLKTNSLVTLIAGFSIILLIILFLVFLFCRRSRSNRTKQSKCVKKSLSRSLIEFDNDYKVQSDFPVNKKQIFSSFKREPTSSTRTNSIISLNNTNNSNNISLTKVNHAIQQLNNQPAKSILKKVSDSLIGVQVVQSTVTEDLNHDSSLKFERQVNRNTILNAAIGNGHRTSRRSLIYDPKRTSVCSLSSSSSISLASSSSSESISSSLSKSNKNDKPNLSYDSSESISSIVLQEPTNKTSEKNDFLKVQDYLNELNILSKQNTFAQLNELDTQANDSSPVKPVSLMLTSYQSKLSQSPPRPNSLLTQSPLSHPTNQMLHLQIGKHNYEETNLFTNSSETSSGYLSNSTTNLNQLVKSTLQVTRLDQLMKSESKESLYETDEYYSIEHKTARDHKSKHGSDSNESNSSSRSSSALTPTPPLCTKIYLSPGKKQSVDKRFSYLIATASANNLDST